MMDWFLWLTFVIPIAYSVFGNFINVGFDSLMLVVLILVIYNCWYTFCYFFYMIRNGWDLIKILIMVNLSSYRLFKFNHWLVMFFYLSNWLVMFFYLNNWLVVLLSWWSRSHSCGLFLLIATVEFFFYDFVMFNWLNIIFHRNFSFSSFLNLRNLCFILFIRILIWLVSDKPVSLKVIFLSRLFLLFFLLSTIRWFAGFWCWALLFSHIFIVELMHKVNDLLKLNDLWVQILVFFVLVLLGHLVNINWNRFLSEIDKNLLMKFLLFSSFVKCYSSSFVLSDINYRDGRRLEFQSHVYRNCLNMLTVTSWN